MISIGKMALACHVSVKTLRYYDQIGLLKAAAIDPNSGYRCYRIDQVETMIRISRYKRFGFSLGDIARLLDGSPSSQAVMLEGQKWQLQKQISELEMALRDLEVVLERIQTDKEKTTMQNYQIDIQVVPAVPVFARRTIMSIGDFGEAYGQLYEEMGRKNIRPEGVNGARYFDSEFNDASSDIEIFVPVDKKAANASIGGAMMAHTVHTGGYSTLNEAYAALVAWIEENGYDMAGAPYEIYTRNGYDRIPVSQWETDIYFPVVKK